MKRLPLLILPAILSAVVLSSAVLPPDRDAFRLLQTSATDSPPATVEPAAGGTAAGTTPTPFPTLAPQETEGMVVYQDPFNAFFLSVPESAVKRPGDRPAVFQLRKDEYLLFLEKTYLAPPTPQNLEDLVDAILYLRIIQERIGDRFEVHNAEMIGDYLMVNARYFSAGKEKGQARFALRTVEKSVFALVLLTPDYPSVGRTWESVVSSFKLVSMISTPLPASSTLQHLSSSGGEALTLPDEVRDTYRVPQGTYYRIEDFDQSLAQLGTYKAMGTAHYPQDFVIRTRVTWWNASGSVNWSEAGCGFVFRYLDRNNYYAIYWGLDGKTYLKRVNKGQSLDIFDGRYNNKNQARGEAVIMFSVSGDQITAFVNGKRIYRTVDSPLRGSMNSGELGLAVFSGTSADFGTRCKMTETELWEVSDKP